MKKEKKIKRITGKRQALRSRAWITGKKRTKKKMFCQKSSEGEPQQQIFCWPKTFSFSVVTSRAAHFWYRHKELTCWTHEFANAVNSAHNEPHQRTGCLLCNHLVPTQTLPISIDLFAGAEALLFAHFSARYSHFLRFIDIFPLCMFYISFTLSSVSERNEKVADAKKTTRFTRSTLAKKWFFLSRHFLC